MEVIRENKSILDTNNTMVKVFFRMFLGLLGTAISAYYTYKSGLYITIANGMSYAILAIIEIAVVLLFSFMFRKLSPTLVTILFYLYAFINGVTFGIIFAIYDLGTIGYAFGITSLLFGGLALYGNITKRDISKFGTILTVALVVGLIISIFNLFMGSTMIEIILDWVMLAVFSGLTIYDMNKIKSMEQIVEYDTEKFYIYGAMQLYLDFINIFIRLLSILGRKRN